MSSRDALRQRTGAAHQRLHEQKDFIALRQGTLARPRYVRLLRRLLGIHAPIEELLAPYEASPEIGWHADPAASRSARLRQDLAALGEDPDAIWSAPRADQLLPPIHSVAAALGCAWVVEGSALGGRLLALLLRSTMGIGVESGAAFFTPLPSQSERWHACCASIEALGAYPRQMAEMLGAAEATFEVFANWMEAA